MERLSAKKRVAVVGQYLSGSSYDEIAGKIGVGKGTVANVVADLKAGKFPEVADIGEHIELLRELSIDLNRSKLTPGQCALGLAVLARINECGLDPADIDRWPLILKSVRSEDEAREFVRLIYSVQEVQKKTGLSLEDLDDKVHDLERKAADLEPMSRQYEDYKKQISELTGQREELVREVTSLEQKYKLLNPRVNDLEKCEQDLLRRTKDMGMNAEKAEVALTALSRERQRPLDIGLSPEALTEFGQKLQSVAQHHHIPPAQLRGRLLQELESLSQGIGLETLIQSRKLELGEEERAIAVTKEESESLKAVVGSLKQEKIGLEASIKETREKVSMEMAKITVAARDTINTLVAELRRSHDEALVEVRRLRDEALEVGKEAGRYEEMLQANTWLSELLAMVRGEENIEGKRVRVISLLVLRGTAAWLKHNKANNLAVSTLSFTLENLIREVEQWKA